MAEAPRTSHPYLTYDAVLSQPDAIELALAREADGVSRLAADVRSAERVHLVGIGTSWHAALAGEWLLRNVGGIDFARAWSSFEFSHAAPRLTASDLVVVLSHRGNKRYSARALAVAREAGAVTAAVTGIGSAIDDGAARHVLRTCPQERSPVFTVSHSTALSLLAALAVETGGEAAEGLRPALEQLHVLMEWALAVEPRLRPVARELRDVRWLALAGWGANTATAYEGGLKLNEGVHALAQGFELEQLIHGPIVAFDERDALVAFVTPDARRERAHQLLRAAGAIGVRTVVFAEESDRETASLCTHFVGLPAVPDALTPVTFLGPLHLLTYWLAVERSVNPDRFRQDEAPHKRARELYDL